MERAIERANFPEEANAIKGPLVGAYMFSGQPEKAAKLMQEVVALRAKGQMPATYMAIANFGLGKHEEAMDWLEQAYRERDAALLSIKPLVMFEVLKDNPRFRTLMQRIGIPL